MQRRWWNDNHSISYSWASHIRHFGNVSMILWSKHDIDPCGSREVLNSAREQFMMRVMIVWMSMRERPLSRNEVKEMLISSIIMSRLRSKIPWTINQFYDPIDIYWHRKIMMLEHHVHIIESIILLCSLLLDSCWENFSSPKSNMFDGIWCLEWKSCYMREAIIEHWLRCICLFSSTNNGIGTRSVPNLIANGFSHPQQHTSTMYPCQAVWLLLSEPMLSGQFKDICTSSPSHGANGI